MNTDRLNDILSPHMLYLESGGQRGKVADLSHEDLSGLNLSNVNLSGANLFCTNLNCANLSGANLSRANLSGANLSRADLVRANLFEATLSRADMYKANMSSANLTKANLTNADLYSANLLNADLSWAVMSAPFMYFHLSIHYGYTWNGFVTIGCQTRTIDMWLADYRRIGAEENYNGDAIEEYGNMLMYISNNYRPKEKT